MALSKDEQAYLAGLKNATVNTNYGLGRQFAPSSMQQLTAQSTGAVPFAETPEGQKINTATSASMNAYNATTKMGIMPRQAYRYLNPQAKTAQQRPKAETSRQLLYDPNPNNSPFKSISFREGTSALPTPNTALLEGGLTNSSLNETSAEKFQKFQNMYDELVRKYGLEE